jgi:hypothetical protein
LAQSSSNRCKFVDRDKVFMQRLLDHRLKLTVGQRNREVEDRSCRRGYADSVLTDVNIT